MMKLSESLIHHINTRFTLFGTQVQVNTFRVSRVNFFLQQFILIVTLVAVHTGKLIKTLEGKGVNTRTDGVWQSLFSPPNTVAQQSTYEFTFSDLLTGQTAPADHYEVFGPATYAYGTVNVSVVAPYPVEVCFQEGMINLGSLEATCNSEGYLPATTSTTSTTEALLIDGTRDDDRKTLAADVVTPPVYTYQTILYLRSNIIYGVSARWAISDNPHGLNES